MKKMKYLWAAFLLLAAASIAPAQELIITPSGLVTVGTVLHFSAVLGDEQADCQTFEGQRPIGYFAGFGNWRTESVFPAPNSGTQTYNFQATYTVTEADIKDPNFCFILCAHSSGCWVQARCFDETRKCPQTKFIFPHIRLRKHLDCSPIPGCPNCRMLDLGQLIQSIGDPSERVQVVLLRNGRRFALLGEAGQGRRLPAQAKITLPVSGRSLSRGRHVDVFLLQVLGRNGQVLASEEVTLRVK